MFLHKFDIFRNERAVTETKVAQTVTNLPSNDEITRFDGTQVPLREEEFRDWNSVTIHGVPTEDKEAKGMVFLLYIQEDMKRGRRKGWEWCSYPKEKEKVDYEY